MFMDVQLPGYTSELMNLHAISAANDPGAKNQEKHFTKTTF